MNGHYTRAAYDDDDAGGALSARLHDEHASETICACAGTHVFGRTNGTHILELANVRSYAREAEVVWWSGQTLIETE